MLGTGLAGGHGDQAVHAACRVIAAAAAQAAVDDQADAFNGERTFGNTGRQHQLAAAAAGRSDGAPLFGERQMAVQRNDLELAGPAGGRKGLGGGRDLPLTGQKNQHGLRLLGLLEPMPVEPMLLETTHHLGR